MTQQGRLIVPPKRRVPRRRGVLWASLVIVVLAVSFGAVAVAAFRQGAAPPPASLTPAPQASPSATGTIEPAPAGVEDSLTDVIDGQTVRLELPAGDAVGIAVLFPGAADDPAALLAEPWALELGAAGWAVATSDFHGTSWGSPSSTTDLQALLTWVRTQTDASPLLFVSTGMGATTSLAAIARQPLEPVACWYSAAPVVDLVSQVETEPAVQDQILEAWGRAPGTDETPLASIGSLPTETAYRVIAPPEGSPELLAENSAALVSGLESSGHTVTTTTPTAPADAAVAIEPDDLLGFAEGCGA
ncbi:MAG TPA: hypothetical protein VNT50_09195 [Microbacterium sp.]|uniref:hypothetical protein n=1 Tax=Microbacterium sp. TaxID=51671 RepID=UPI002CFA506E|nr:hypothetical protein [Microbacterium sp.]HWI31658.1 hypothetical protein [Microbacterium sp.]